ncbi:MAG: hypothetical protein AAGF85_04920 [Bacteroidota bacterium]
MKNNLLIKIGLLSLLFTGWACESDDADFGFFTSPTETPGTNTDVTSPTGMLNISANFIEEMTVKLGDTLTVEANFSDDLALGAIDINIIDAEPALLLDTTINLSGTSVSLTFDYIIPYVANSQSVGDIMIEAEITDAAGNSLITDDIILSVIQPEFTELFLLNGTESLSMIQSMNDVHSWELTTSLEAMQALLLATSGDTTGFVWGDTSDPQDGIAELSNTGIINAGDAGDYSITFNDISFEYAINTLTFDEIFLIGNFNGWGDARPEDAMTKVGTNDWIITTEFNEPDGVDPVALADIQFKFVAGANFGDGVKDWGQDPNQTPTPQGGVAIDGEGEQNINPGFTSVPVTITFNDLTGVYGISTIASNFPELHLIGNFSGWGNNDGALSVPMTLVADNLWEGEIDPNNFDSGYNPADNIEFKFVLAPTFGVQDFGDDGQDFVADDTGSESNVVPGIAGGNYIVQFNDQTLEYNIGTVRNIDMFIIGNFSGWGGGTSNLSPEMRLTDEDTWSVVIDPVNFVDGFTGDYIFKVVNEPDFVNQTAWGPSGDITALTGIGDDDGGAPNFEPGFNTGSFQVTFNDETFEYVISN